MSGKCEGTENCRGQIGDCIDSLYNIQQLLCNGHVISDSNSFAKSLDKIQGAIADLSRVIVAPCSAEDSKIAATYVEMLDYDSSEIIDVLTPGTGKTTDLIGDVSKNGDDEFDSIMCDMNDEEFDMAVNSQPLTSSDVNVSSEGSHKQSSIVGDMPLPCQQHVDKLKQVFGHSQFKP